MFYTFILSARNRKSIWCIDFSHAYRYNLSIRLISRHTFTLFGILTWIEIFRPSERVSCISAALLILSLVSSGLLKSKRTILFCIQHLKYLREGTEIHYSEHWNFRWFSRSDLFSEKSFNQSNFLYFIWALKLTNLHSSLQSLP